MARMIDADALMHTLEIDPDNCSKCKHDHDCNHSYYSRNEICLTIQEAPTIGGWVSVKDRLPEDGQTVVAYEKLGRYMDITVFYKAKGVWDTPDGWYGMDRISHWMPLPTPPEEVKLDG